MTRPITDIVNEGEALGVVGGVAASLPVGATSEEIDDRVAALLAAGANVTLTYDDVAGTLTIAAAGGAVAVEDEGTEILASASRFDFTGAGVTVTDGGAGQANIAIPGGGGSSSVLAETIHNPATIASIDTTSTSPSDVDATNLVVTFTAPASGVVVVELSALPFAGGNASISWGLRSGTTDVVTPAIRAFYNGDTTSSQLRTTVPIRVAGLTSGASYTYKWSHARDQGSGSVGTIWGGLAGAAIMRVRSA